MLSPTLKEYSHRFLSMPTDDVTSNIGERKKHTNAQTRAREGERERESEKANKNVKEKRRKIKGPESCMRFCVGQRVR